MNKLLRCGANKSFRSFVGKSLFYGKVPNLIITRSSKTNISLGSINNVSKDKTVGKWLFGCGSMVFLAVGLGGVTRLTESGLSMVTWKMTGEHMPRNSAEWAEEFKKYQQYPEFKLKNSSMTLKEFQFIYIMEYVHRMWGRAIGAFFFIPAAYFWKKGYFNGRTKKFVSLIGTLILGQGLMGWYMVKSGLEDRFQNVNDIPRVSQYRLASHLALAFILYALLISKSLEELLPAQSFVTISKGAVSLRRFSYFFKSVVFLTAISGAFVAGLDAGLVYNSFPKMGDNWIPSDLLSFMPIHRNFTENPTTVQFDHRILGITTVSLSTVLWFLSRRTGLPKRAIWAINSVAAIAWLQVSLGITTLLNYVPVSLAAAHQSGSLILLTMSIWLCHEVRFLKYVPK